MVAAHGAADVVSVIQPRRCIGLLLALCLLLSLAGLEVVLARHLWGDARQHGLSKIFDLDVENNVPTWFSSTCLFLCAIALWLIGKIERPRHHPNVS